MNSLMIILSQVNFLKALEKNSLKYSDIVMPRFSCKCVFCITIKILQNEACNCMDS